MQSPFIFVRRAGARLVSVALAACLAGAASPAMAQVPQASFTVSFTGLPGGLSITLRSELLVCADGTSHVPAGSATMRETVRSEFTRVDTIDGPRFALVQRSTYTAQLQPTQPFADPLCNPQQEGHNLQFTADLAGPSVLRRQLTRRLWTDERFISSGSFTLTRHFAAASAFDRFILPAGQTGPITLTRGTDTVVGVDHRNPISVFSTVRPALQFVRNSGPLTTRLIASIFRGDDGRPCVTAGGSTVCKGDVPDTAAHGFIHGGVELLFADHQQTGANLAADTSHSHFRFKLTSAFPVGNFTLVSAANDADPFPYLVNGVLTTLDLMPWNAVFHAVAVQ